MGYSLMVQHRNPRFVWPHQLKSKRAWCGRAEKFTPSSVVSAMSGSSGGFLGSVVSVAVGSAVGLSLGSWNHMALVIIIRKSRANAQVSLCTRVKYDFRGRTQMDTHKCYRKNAPQSLLKERRLQNRQTSLFLNVTENSTNYHQTSLWMLVLANSYSCIGGFPATASKIFFFR